MNIGVSSYSFSRLMGPGGMTLMQVIASAKEMGFDAIEFAGLDLPKGETAISFAPQARAACLEKGLAIANYTIGADFLTGSGGDLQAEIDRIKAEARVAAALGAPGMRHDASRGFPTSQAGAKSFDDALPRLAEACRAVTEFAADLGVRTMVENHGYFCQDSERVEKLVCRVNHSNFGALIDIGNFACADEDCAAAVARLAPYAFHAHVKDFHCKPGILPNPGEGWFPSRAGNFLRGAIIGHGDVPVAQCLRVLRAAGYAGPVSMEFEGLEDPRVGIRLGHENLCRMLTIL